MLSEGKAAGLEAWVEGMDSKNKLNEYQIRHHDAIGDEPPYTECFLETTDESFAIQVRKLHTFSDTTDLHSEAYIDGNPIGSGYGVRIGVKHFKWDKLLIREDDQYHKINFKFCPLPTTDDPLKVTIDPTAIKRLGTIEITFWPGFCHHDGLHAEAVTKLTSGIAHEGLKKYLSTRNLSMTPDGLYRGANKIACEQPRVVGYRFSKLDKENSPSYRFVFKYRPRPVLVLMRIIDEPEQEERSMPFQPRRKRKIPAGAVDISSDTEEGEDVKPYRAFKRIRYLEDQLKNLTSRMKKASNEKAGKADIVDLTLDDED
ncbi:uncharacterized protein IL334_002686 [Kwoniella shivajii]|uniref:DUF7918 domain-containing protein n=1 Tax=Kwoniella shivajii TaxID=564305 RepID=A0ABZ1CVF4_9TREE|nr:hypothetical protein IL334_002686 [Kwoniella shivajii]